MKRVLFFLLTLFSVIPSSSAREVLFRRSVPFAEAICNFGGNKIGLFLRHDQPVNPETKDTRGAPLVYLGGPQVHLVQMLGEPTPGDFLFLAPEGNNLCDKTRAFDLGNGFAALFYLQDNRPYQDIYHLIVYNYKTDRVLEKKSLGTVSNLIPLKDSFAYSVLIPRTDVHELEMTSTSGRKMKAIDKDLNAYHLVKVRKTTGAESLQDEIDPNLSFERNEWKRFFKNKPDFLKTAGWDKTQKKFKNEVVYEASHFDSKESDLREICIALTAKRGGDIDAKSWRCKKEKP